MKIGDLVAGYSDRIDGCIGIIVDKVRPLNLAEYLIMWGTGRLSSHYPYELIVIKSERAEQ